MATTSRSAPTTRERAIGPGTVSIASAQGGTVQRCHHKLAHDRFVGFVIVEGRASCFQSLLDALGNQLRSTYDVWTDSRFAEVGLRPARVLRTPHDVCVHGPNVLTSFIAVARLQSQTMRQYDLFVNLHKGCGKRMPVTFRNAVLLNSAKLIVSDRCHPRDD